jgi:hypothetical protein
MSYVNGRKNTTAHSSRIDAMSSEPPNPDSLPDPRNFQYYGEYSESGVDISLIKYLLSLPPIERVQLMERRARETSWIRENARPVTKARPG